MPNGQYILNDLEFDTKIKGMNDRTLAEFTAKLAYSNAIRITSLENANKEKMGIAGGAGALLGGVIAAAVNFFIGK
jgi:hypothetical protein